MSKKVKVNQDKAKQMVEKCFSNGMLLWITKHAWGNRKRMHESILVEKFGVDDAKIVRAVQDVVDKEPVKNITKWLHEATKWVEKPCNSMEWFNNSTYYIPFNKVEECEVHLKYCSEKVKEYAKVLSETIRDLDNKQREDHPGIHDSSYVPTSEQILSKFNLEWGWLQISYPVSGELQAIPKSLVDEQNRKYEERIKAAGQAHIDMMRKAFNEMMLHLRNVLKDPKKTFKESTLEKPKQFLKALKEIELPFKDKPFQEMADDILDALDGVYASDLRDDDEYREAIGDVVDDLVETFKSIPVMEIERAVDF